ncbi:MAG: hypothetical protein ACT4QF_02750 [Sporichthyaceae bacterium]
MRQRRSYRVLDPGRAFVRLLLTVVVGLFALLAFDSVAHADEAPAAAGSATHRCLGAAAHPDGSAEGADRSSEASIGAVRTGPPIAGATASAADLTGAEQATESGAGHGALQLCVALVALAAAARWFRRFGCRALGRALCVVPGLVCRTGPARVGIDFLTPPQLVVLRV